MQFSDEGMVLRLDVHIRQVCFIHIIRGNRMLHLKIIHSLQIICKQKLYQCGCYHRESRIKCELKITDWSATGKYEWACAVTHVIKVTAVVHHVKVAPSTSSHDRSVSLIIDLAYLHLSYSPGFIRPLLNLVSPLFLAHGLWFRALTARCFIWSFGSQCSFCCFLHMIFPALAPGCLFHLAFGAVGSRGGIYLVVGFSRSSPGLIDTDVACRTPRGGDRSYKEPCAYLLAS